MYSTLEASYYDCWMLLLSCTLITLYDALISYPVFLTIIQIWMHPLRRSQDVISTKSKHMPRPTRHHFFLISQEEECKAVPWSSTLVNGRPDSFYCPYDHESFFFFLQILGQQPMQYDMDWVSTSHGMRISLYSYCCLTEEVVMFWTLMTHNTLCKIHDVV